MEIVFLYVTVFNGKEGKGKSHIGIYLDLTVFPNFPSFPFESYAARIDGRLFMASVRLDSMMSA